MNKWLTADYHLGEDRWQMMQRPFTRQLDMIDALVFFHNEVVEDEDMVYINGDVIYQRYPEFLKEVARFKGKKVLFRGNHDRVLSDQDLSKYFDHVIPEGEGMEIEIEGLPCYITHYPSRSRLDRFNLVGHVHGAFKFQLNMLNVGVDVHHFSPVAFNQIPFFFKAISEFYDEDVWAAYHPANSQYLGQRGKKGTYLDSMNGKIT
jgi:calcineurin-like phosphoesterase family protein